MAVTVSMVVVVVVVVVVVIVVVIAVAMGFAGKTAGREETAGEERGGDGVVGENREGMEVWAGSEAAFWGSGMVEIGRGSGRSGEEESEGGAAPAGRCGEGEGFHPHPGIWGRGSWSKAGREE